MSVTQTPLTHAQNNAPEPPGTGPTATQPTAPRAQAGFRPPHSAARTWLRALELTAPIAAHPWRTFPVVLAEAASRHPDAPALLSDRECYTYAQLLDRANRYARWALAQPLAAGDVVCLLMSNRPEYVAAWLGLTGVGVTVALLNTNLRGAALAHSVAAVAPRHLIAASEFLAALDSALPQLQSIPALWAHGQAPTPSGAQPPASPACPRIDLDLLSRSGATLSAAEQRPPAIDDLALYIYTSGTTGLPKAARVTHARVMQWTHWFAGMMDLTPEDRLYNCLPMYHSVGGVQAPGAALAAGAAVVLREKFSASAFWPEIRRWDCTLFQYIGELCRYLLHTPADPDEGSHRIRLACGNGLAPEVWTPFQERFAIPRILEFYAATESNISLFNVEGRPGSIGSVPSYLAHRFSPALVRIDPCSGEPLRDEAGLCLRCAPDEPGEALGKVTGDPAAVGSRFDGYTSRAASERKLLRHVFEPGDAWFRTGDLLRRDARGFFYFVDRLGDTFRRKGENVSTSEVASVLCGFPGIRHASVYGVSVPGADGKAGMAALVCDAAALDLGGLHAYLAEQLPSYARPVFVRLRAEADLTGTLKYSKTALAAEGYQPQSTPGRLDPDQVYLDLPEAGSFVPLDPTLLARLERGELRL